jgi:hypothetical protein
MLARVFRFGNIQRKALGLKPHDRYNLFDKHGELDPDVLMKSLITGGGLGIWGDLFTKVAQNADNISDFLNRNYSNGK